MNGCLSFLTCFTIASLLAHSAYAFTRRNECAGYAARFDGTNWLNAGQSPGSELGEYTLEFWVKPLPNKADQVSVMGSFVQTGIGSGFGFMMNKNQIVFMDSQPFHSRLSSAIRFNEWTHVAGTYGPNGTELYINGMNMVHRGGQQTLRHNSEGFFIGRRPDKEQGFAGELAEVRLWDRQRSQEEISNTLDKPVSASSQGLVAYWTMRSSGGFFILDETNKNPARFGASKHLPVITQTCIGDPSEEGCQAENRCVPALQLMSANKRQAVALPDITIDASRAQSSMYLQQESFEYMDCAVVEGCTSVGNRMLLRFDTATPNVGSASLVLGNPVNNPEFYYFAPCHNHYHLKGYVSYMVYSHNLTPTAIGAKQAFCVEDEELDPNWTGARNLLPEFNCNYQGISVGWEDVYTADLDCQWVDITDIPLGSYWLYLEVNPVINGTRLFAESDYANNVAWIPFRLEGSS
jgi:hypothetical protein